MTLQDAGWKGGPFIGKGDTNGVHSIYTTWRNYYANVANNDPKPDWKVSQEDMLVSLVWGSQVMQRIAQQVRVSENKIIQSEKMASMAKVWAGNAYPQADLEAGWRTLMLSQHHDCWIVPYNGKHGDTWADKVVGWTAFTNNKSDSVIKAAGDLIAKVDEHNITVYNTLGISRTETVWADVPTGMEAKNMTVFNAEGQQVTSQVINSEQGKIAFRATVPSMGYAVYQLKPKN
jgi:alpha-mannosidase